MEQIDSRLEAIIQGEVGAGDQVLEFCAATTDLTPPFPAPLIPISILGFSFLSVVTGIGLFAFVSLGIIVAAVVYFFTHFKNYLVAATESDLLLIRVSSNLLTRLDVRKLRYGQILSVVERSPAPKMVVEIEIPGEALKLQFVTRLPKLASSQVRATNLLRILREKVAASQAAADAVTQGN